MSDEPVSAETREKPRTPTDLLITALEAVEEMDEVMVLFRLKKDGSGHGGMGWVTPFNELPEKLAFMEEAKIAMYHTIYGPRDEE
jgi:hypothetical protein